MTKLMLKRVPVLVAGVFAVLTATSPFALAQSGVGISPPRVEVRAQRGATVTQVVSVDNPSVAAEVVVDVDTSDVLLGPDGSMIWAPSGSHSRSLGPWLTVNPLRFELGPGERADIPYTISVPEDAADGTYWAVLFFETTEPESRTEQEGVGVVSRVRVGLTVYLTIGEPTYLGKIVGIRFTGRDETGVLDVTFQNIGSGVIRLDGHVELRANDGGLVQTSTISDQVSFPGATHSLRFQLDEPIAAGEYMVLALLEDGTGRAILGESTVTVP